MNDPTVKCAQSHPRLRLMLVVVFLIGTAIYLPTLSYPFVYDDIPILVDHGITNGKEPWYRFWEAAYWPQPTASDPLYRPLTLLSLRIDHELWNGHPSGYRLVSVLLHGWASALTGLVAWRAFGRMAIAWLAGLLFAVHPIHGEVLGMLVGRSELLCGLFMLLQVSSHLTHVQGDWKPRWRHHLFMSLMFFLGMCSKEHGAFALPVIAAIDLAYGNRMPRETASDRFRRLMASHYLGLAYAFVVFMLLRANLYGWLNIDASKEISPFANPMINATAAQRLWTPFGLFALSWLLWFWPPMLTPVWSLGGFDLANSPARWDVALGVLLAIAMCAAVVAGYRRRTPLGWMLAAGAVLLIIPTHAIPAANWLFAERWLYVPSIFFALISAGLLVRSPKAALFASLVVGIGLAVTALDYQRSWQNNVSIFARTLKHHPTSYQGLVGMCGSLCQNQLFEQIDPYVDRLLENYPTAPQTWLFQTVRLGEEADPNEVIAAVNQFRKYTGWEEVPSELAVLEAKAKARLPQASPY